MTKEELIQDFIRKMDYSYNYKTSNERANIIAELHKIAECEQSILNVVGVTLKDKKMLNFEEYKTKFFKKQKGDSYIKISTGQNFNYGQILKEYQH
jgi:hypothetical protein